MLNEELGERAAISSRGFNLLWAGVILVFIGIAVIIVGLLVLGNSGSVGGVIFIGPIPIIFGAGPNATWLIAIGVVLTIISIVLFVVLNRKSR